MQISIVLGIQPQRQDVGIRKSVKRISSCVGTRYRRGPAGVDTRKCREKMASGCCSGASSCGKSAVAVSAVSREAPGDVNATSAVGELLQAVKLGESDTAVTSSVQEYYGKTLQTSEDLKTSACCTAQSPHPIVREALKSVPDEIKAKYYGCGSPFPFGIEGLRVLDLGSGSGRDCYVCAALVGEKGFVTGIDMTANQLDVARKYVDTYCTDILKYSKPNMKFVEGKIEDLKSAGIEDNSIDMIISNCVVNLSPDKASVLKEAYRVLAPGGEMYFSDVYCDRRLPAEIRAHPILLGECLGGALYNEDFLRLARSAGFEDPRCLATPSEIEIKDKELKLLLGNARFFSITYRLFKIPGALESLCEDYGQAAKYKGTIPGHEFSYILDDHHEFQTGKWYEVCGNTAAMVGDSWLGRNFEIIGDRSVHYGLFDCGGSVPASSAPAPGGSCC